MVGHWQVYSSIVPIIIVVLNPVFTAFISICSRLEMDFLLRLNFLFFLGFMVFSYYLFCILNPVTCNNRRCYYWIFSPGKRNPEKYCNVREECRGWNPSLSTPGVFQSCMGLGIGNGPARIAAGAFRINTRGTRLLLRVTKVCTASTRYSTHDTVLLTGIKAGDGLLP